MADHQGIDEAFLQLTRDIGMRVRGPNPLKLAWRATRRRIRQIALASVTAIAAVGLGDPALIYGIFAADERTFQIPRERRGTFDCQVFDHRGGEVDAFWCAVGEDLLEALAQLSVLGPEDGVQLHCDR